MKRQYIKHYSQSLGRDMEYLVFGETGRTLIAFPSQNGRFYDHEDFGMIETLRTRIENGELRVICPDSCDGESWSARDKEEKGRVEQHEKWFNYIVDELIPEVRNGKEKFIATGCSMGAYHAANFFFRRPKLFSTLLSLSGIYKAEYFFDDYMDDLLKENSPVDYLRSMKLSNANVDLYRRRKIIICVGQGRWEEDCLNHTRWLDEELRAKKIHAWIDFWGYDVDHDWPWWRKQLPYFINLILSPEK